MINPYQELIKNLPTGSSIVHYEDFYDLFPTLTLLSSTPQDPIYHAEGDVWTHTKMVCDALLAMDEYQNASTSDQFVMFYSALLHDISKPACTKLEEDGRISSAGHSKMGQIDARILLWEKEVPFSIREKICGIVGVHQLPFYAFYNGKSTTKRDRDPALLGNRLSYIAPMNLLFNVAKADMIGRVCPTLQDNLDSLELFRELCLENECFHHPKIFPDNHTKVKYFRGEGAISSDYPFFYEPGSKVTVLSGLPATGKDYWIKNNLPNLPVIGFDIAEQELKLRHGENNGKVMHYVHDKAKELLRKKEPFVFNATHIITDLRNKTLDLLYAYNSDVRIVYLEASKKTIFDRNNKRDTSLTNSHIEKMLNRWDVPTIMEAQEVDYFIK